MKKNSHLNRIVVCQNLGFVAILLIGYLDDLIQLPNLIFSGHPFQFAHSQTTLNMLLVLTVWFLVSNSTRRIMERVRYLEKFMRVCSWCRRINYQGEWMPLEKFMRQGFDTPTTHGICHECLERQQAAAERAKQARKMQAALEEKR